MATRQITWQNINAPDLAPVSRMMQVSSARAQGALTDLASLMENQVLKQQELNKGLRDFYTQQAQAELALKAYNNPEVVEGLITGLSSASDPDQYLRDALVTPGAVRAAAGVPGAIAPAAPYFDVAALTSALPREAATQRANKQAKDSYLESEASKIDSPRLNAHIVQIASSKDKNALLAMGTPEYLTGTFQSRGAQEQTAKAVAARLQALQEEDRQAARDADTRATHAAQRKAYEAQLSALADAKNAQKQAAQAEALEAKRLAGIDEQYSPLGIRDSKVALLSDWLTPELVKKYHGKERFAGLDWNQFDITDNDVISALSTYADGFTVDIPTGNGKTTKMKVPLTTGAMNQVLAPLVASGDEGEFDSRMGKMRTAMEIILQNPAANAKEIARKGKMSNIGDVDISNATLVLLHAKRAAEELGAVDQGATANLSPSVVSHLLRGAATDAAAIQAQKIIDAGGLTLEQSGKQLFGRPIR